MTDAPDGTQLANYRWPCHAGSNRPRSLYLLHGLSEYAGRYEHVAGWLNARGWDVAAHDHRGHGRSGGKRATLRRHDDLVLDAESRIAAWAAESGTTPVLLGHSLGGLVATHVALRGKVPLAGLVLSSPALKLRITPMQRGLVRLLGAIAPDLRLPHARPQPELSHDRAVTDAYVNDPLVKRRMTGRLAAFLLDGGRQAVAQARSLPCRTLMLVAGDDRIVDSSGSREFADAAPPGKVAMRWYDNAWHEVLNESAEIATPVYADLDAWLAQIEPGGRNAL